MRAAIIDQIRARQGRVAELTKVFNAPPAADPERSGVHLIEAQRRAERHLVDRLTTWPATEDE